MARTNMKKGTKYATLVIRIPIVASRQVDPDYAAHLVEHEIEHIVKAVIAYGVSRPIGDEELVLDAKSATWCME